MKALQIGVPALRVAAVIILASSQAAFADESVSCAYDDWPASQVMYEAAPDTTPAAPRQYFIAIFSLGPAWQTDKPAHEQLYFKEHSANLRKWREEKKIALGARYSDKGMIVLSATDEVEARSWLENDPMVLHKLFSLEIYPFSPFYLGCLEKK